MKNALIAFVCSLAAAGFLFLFGSIAFAGHAPGSADPGAPPQGGYTALRDS